jgi:hypothetical protein
VFAFGGCGVHFDELREVYTGYASQRVMSPLRELWEHDRVFIRSLKNSAWERICIESYDNQGI